jgi:cytochrome c oxidase assembly protein subunit 11
MSGRTPSNDSKRRNAGTAVVLFAAAAGMVGASFAAVPLYRLFCQVTGYGGTTQVAEAAPGAVGERHFTIRFNAAVNSDLPWDFGPVQREVRVLPGEPGLAFYRALNPSDENTVGSASYNVTPLKAGIYFSKVACFCFEEQPLAAGESAELPVSFFVDPEILEDPNLDDVTTITLSYTFFRRRDLEPSAQLAEASADRQSPSRNQ